MRIFNLIIIFVCCVFSGVACAVLDKNAITWQAFAAVEDVNNLHGGIKTGAVYLATGEVLAIYDTKIAGWWRDGKFFVGIFGLGQTHDQSLYTGSIQNPSNLTGTPTIRFSDLAYEHQLNQNTMVHVGIMDIENYFNVTHVSDYVCNSGHHTQAWSANVQLSTTPNTGFGAMGRYKNQVLTVQAGVYQGNPQHQLPIFNHGYLILGEVAGDFAQTNLLIPSVIAKAEAWQYHQKDPNVGTSNYGFYAIVEAIWNSKSGHNFDLAVILGAAERRVASVYDSAALCFSMSRLFDTRPFDRLNFALGTTWIAALYPETYYEVGYTMYLTKNIALTPDIQYFTHPGGQYPNAWTGLLRLTYVL